MASITQKGNTYQITVSNGFDVNGKRIKVKTTFKPDPSLTPAKTFFLL